MHGSARTSAPWSARRHVGPMNRIHRTEPLERVNLSPVAPNRHTLLLLFFFKSTGPELFTAVCCSYYMLSVWKFGRDGFVALEMPTLIERLDDTTAVVACVGSLCSEWGKKACWILLLCFPKKKNGDTFRGSEPVEQVTHDTGCPGIRTHHRAVARRKLAWAQARIPRQTTETDCQVDGVIQAGVG